MLRLKVLVAGLFAALLFASPSLAQEKPRNEVSVQGTGFITRDSEENGIRQHTTDSGGLLASYRFRFNRWLAADGSYGYTRNTLQNFTSAGAFNVQADMHQTTGALVVTSPRRFLGLSPYALAGAGTLVFDPTGNPGGFVSGAERQTKAAFVYGGGADIDLTRRFCVEGRIPRAHLQAARLRAGHAQRQYDRTYGATISGSCHSVLTAPGSPSTTRPVQRQGPRQN